MKKRTTLLTVPHSKKGFGSKRAARGKLHFENGKFLDANVKYKTTALYPNAMDPEDIAVAVCDDNFMFREKNSPITVMQRRLLRHSSSYTPWGHLRTQPCGMASERLVLRNCCKATLQHELPVERVN